ncbi:MAG: VOC family protein [Chloroflexota bacterium]|nr:VOC family protein [Chloroflexota bacterium]
MRLHHVQVTLPAGGEDEARRFYAGVLGLPEITKPSELAGRGGIWFRLGEVHLHFGVEASGPTSRRHIALQVDDAAVLREALQASGYPHEEAVPLDGMRRFYCRDPFGNRLEILEKHSPTAEAASE